MSQRVLGNFLTRDDDYDDNPISVMPGSHDLNAKDEVQHARRAANRSRGPEGPKTSCILLISILCSPDSDIWEANLR